MFRNFPDFKGIKTAVAENKKTKIGLETSLTSKGLRLEESFNFLKSYSLETSLTSKGLRLTVRPCASGFRFRNFPDFKGIKTE